MKVYPQPLEIGDHEGFSPEKDIFGRAQLASGMTNLVGTVEDPLVIAFDGAWGSGKTTFLKMWAGELRKTGHPVIFFDAFENDYVEDAFAALARELIELAEEKAPKSSKVAKNIRDKAVDLGALLARGTAKIGLKMAVRAATAGLASSDDLKDLGEVVTAEAEDVAEAYMEQLLDKPRKQKETVESFRKALANLACLLSPPPEGEMQKPLVFIIDELDRCKPLFALALLERVKHFMAVPNVHFVLGVHQRQLESSVRYAYGRDIDAGAYLQKFINMTVTVDVPADRYDRVTQIAKYANRLNSQLDLPRKNDGPVEPTADMLARVLTYYGMTLRTLERAYTILKLSLSFTPPNYRQIGPIIGGLIAMKLLRPDMYRKARHGQLTLSDALDFLFPVDEALTEESSATWEKEWWTFCLSEELPPELKDFAQGGLARERRTLVRYTANEIVERLKA